MDIVTLDDGRQFGVHLGYLKPTVIKMTRGGRVIRKSLVIYDAPSNPDNDPCFIIRYYIGNDTFPSGTYILDSKRKLWEISGICERDTHGNSRILAGMDCRGDRVPYDETIDLVMRKWSGENT